MKIVKQIDENHFEVELDESDIKSRIPKVVVAHDHVMFVGQDWHCTSNQTYGPHGTADVVKTRVAVQIPIRAAQDMLHTILEKKYLKPEHLVRSDGKPAYCNIGYTAAYMYTSDDNVPMIAIEDSETGRFHHMPRKVFETIKNVASEL